MRELTIVGGGLAGLALGIGLRQRAVPVTICEAGQYPRHRVCGEFISGAGQSSLARLGLLERLPTMGTRTATSAAFFVGGRSVLARPLPARALCVSRHTLDDCLAREFQRLGGALRVHNRWSGRFGPGVVRATGRQLEKADRGGRMFGLKVHAHGVTLGADLEMHFVPSGYVGLCRLPGGIVNICGLFRSATTAPTPAQHWRDRLRGPEDSLLHARLANAFFDEASFCSVAGISLRPHRGRAGAECRLGDALTMIPPVTGNGMSMAFEAAEMAIQPLKRFSQGDSGWEEAQQAVATRCDQAFARRLRLAAWLQWALFRPVLRTAVLSLAGRSEWLWRDLFEQTR